MADGPVLNRPGDRRSLIVTPAGRTGLRNLISQDLA